MRKLRERLKDQKGFTLVEMLIVVAIIAILIAVSIPMVTSTLENARHAVDRANFRDAAALGTIEYLQDPDNAAGTYWYVVDSNSMQGKLEKNTTAPAAAIEVECTCGTIAASGTHLKVVIAADGNVTVSWES